jgi:hypothetical protein
MGWWWWMTILFGLNLKVIYLFIYFLKKLLHRKQPLAIDQMKSVFGIALAVVVVI